MQFSDVTLTPRGPPRPSNPDPLSPLEHEYPHQIQRIPTGAAAVELQTGLSSASKRRNEEGEDGSVSRTEADLGGDGSFRHVSLEDEKEEASAQVPSQKRKRIKLKKGIKVPVYGEFTWKQLWQMSKAWLVEPLNVALVFWCIISTIVSVVLVAVELGILNKAIPDEEVRKEWVEVTTQILNALFVLMTVVYHPSFFRHTYQLYRWSPSDIKELRMTYCRGGHRKPREWIHLLNLLLLLHLTCFSMYAFAIIYWVYPRQTRPMSAVLITLIVSFFAPIFAFMYAILSPLQRDYNEVPLAQQQGESKNLHTQFMERTLVFALDGQVVEHPEWQGGLITGCCLQKRTTFLSIFLPFIVFGLNMQRFGFGHRYIQACIFLLVIVGPMLVFELSANVISGLGTKKGLSTLGIALAWFGLIYGAVWRIHVRKAFHLPGDRWFCGSANLTDCFYWLFCPFCALCQEARTAQYYQIVEKSPDGELYVIPEDMAEGGADLAGTDLEMAEPAPAERGRTPMAAPPEVVMHEPIQGTPGKHGFIKMEK